jgi:hypothetical protein
MCERPEIEAVGRNKPLPQNSSGHCNSLTLSTGLGLDEGSYHLPQLDPHTKSVWSSYESSVSVHSLVSSADCIRVETGGHLARVHPVTYGSNRSSLGEYDLRSSNLRQLPPLSQHHVRDHSSWATETVLDRHPACRGVHTFRHGSVC